MNEWIAAAIAVAGGIVIGSLLARIVRGLLTNERRPEALQRSAGAIASLFFSIAVIIGLITALGLVNEAALDQLPEDLVDYGGPIPVDGGGHVIEALWILPESVDDRVDGFGSIEADD